MPDTTQTLLSYFMWLNGDKPVDIVRKLKGEIKQPNTVSAWMRGEARPKRDEVLTALAKLYGIPEEDKLDLFKPFRPELAENPEAKAG